MQGSGPRVIKGHMKRSRYGDHVPFCVCTHRARELEINWTGSRFELIPRIQAEIKRQSEVKNEHEKYQRQLAQNKYLQDEKQRREQERLEGMNETPKFGLSGVRRPLRPEFVRTYPHALNSDVHCVWDNAISSHKEDRMQVEKATEYYNTSVISQLAVELQQRFRCCSSSARRLYHLHFARAIVHILTFIIEHRDLTQQDQWSKR